MFPRAYFPPEETNKSCDWVAPIDSDTKQPVKHLAPHHQAIKVNKRSIVDSLKLFVPNPDKINIMTESVHTLNDHYIIQGNLSV